MHMSSLVTISLSGCGCPDLLQLQEAAGTISDLAEKAEHASEQLNSTVRDYTDQLAAKSESLTVAEQKCSDWESQSDLLHKQLEKVCSVTTNAYSIECILRLGCGVHPRLHIASTVCVLVSMLFTGA